jgi:F-type H+-transporting ATPase subunit b
MLTAIVTRSGESAVAVKVIGAKGVEAETGEAATEEKSIPNPIAPEMKEILWSFIPFLIFLVVMRYVLYPRLRKGMDARYEGIRSDIEGADTAKADARADVAKYESALVEVRAEAAAKLDAARATVDQERSRAVADANARIAAKKAEAEAAAAAERAAVKDQISAAVSTVASAATSMAVGKPADPNVVSQAVTQAMQTVGAR